MSRLPVQRRALPLVLMGLGGVLIFLAPQDIWLGMLLLFLGVGLETAGTLMQRRRTG
jgi:hypothetical protein